MHKRDGVHVCKLKRPAGSGVSNHWTGFSTGMWDWNNGIGPGMRDRNL